MIDQHPRCPTIYLECKINYIVKPDLLSFALPLIFSLSRSPDSTPTFNDGKQSFFQRSFMG